MDILHEFQTLQGIYNSKIQNCRFLDNICACAKLTNEVHGAPQLEKTKKKWKDQCVRHMNNFTLCRKTVCKRFQWHEVELIGSIAECTRNKI